MIGQLWHLVWREGVGVLVGVGLGLMAGFTWWSSIVLGIAVAAFVVVVTRLEPDPEPDWERERHVRPDGSRGDLQDLAWSMVGRDGRAGERAMRRLRETATVRLARHGVDLADPEQLDAVVALVGRRAAQTLTRRSAPLPSVADLTFTLGVLEALGPRPARSDEPVDQPDDQPDDQPADRPGDPTDLVTPAGGRAPAPDQPRTPRPRRNR
ncbi:hypothetical protein [Cellulomonas gelida]|uniref:Uncharacterized protein n=1 Tax=Cellulomonas gelida TaxID=1712 RepID=A0A4Y3KNX5_9CELL|nr:hypothetical protein [Cellulomonas gelida]GEA85742.1 hypothetical protein CGE01nite_29930 [Cellulomonas gelida]GGL39379.1 hypothetical protein GCM10009774_32600 [Cellulomonas gelida]